VGTDSPHNAALNAPAFGQRPTLRQPQADPAGGIDDVEAWVENDPSLAPSGPSKLLVSATVLEPQEIAALLDDLAPLLGRDASGRGKRRRRPRIRRRRRDRRRR
jgi:hypothetical protein